MRFTPVALALVVVAAACGGASGRSDPTVEQIVPSTYLSAAQALATDLGPAGAINATILALDSGYDPDQIVAAAAEGSLHADGLISGVDAAGPELGVIDRSVRLDATSSRFAFVSRHTPITPDEGIHLALEVGSIFDAGFERDKQAAVAIAALLTLTADGYELDQLVEELLRGSSVELAVDGPVIVDGGTVVAPGRSSSASPAAAVSATPSVVADNYTFGAEIDVPTEIGFTTYKWSGTFGVDDGELNGVGSVAGVSQGTCGMNGVATHPYELSAKGTFDIGGNAVADQLAITMTTTGGELTLLDGDSRQPCVDLSYAAALELVQAELNLSVPGEVLLVSADGGSVSIDLGDGAALEVWVTPSVLSS